jgi:hypothetical protein
MRVAFNPPNAPPTDAGLSQPFGVALDVVRLRLILARPFGLQRNDDERKGYQRAALRPADK